MKALYLSGKGDADVLTFGDLPDPVIIDPRDIIVRVRAIAMNRLDIMQREGTLCVGSSLGTIEQAQDTVRTILPKKSPDSIRFCASAVLSNGNTESTTPWITPRSTILFMAPKSSSG